MASMVHAASINLKLVELTHLTTPKLYRKRKSASQTTEVKQPGLVVDQSK